MNKETVMISGFDDSKIDLIKRTIAVGATADELQLFLYQCQRTGLDPFARQIVFQKYKSKSGPDKLSIITSVDGYRLLADRTGNYAGSDDYKFDEGITEYEHIKGKRGQPVTATCTVYKISRNIRAPFTATVRWEEYYPGDLRGFMWKKMPYLMLGKCAEALALRKAFPAELSGIYTGEEMEQAYEGESVLDAVVIEETKKPTNGNGKKPVTKEMNAEIQAAINHVGSDDKRYGDCTVEELKNKMLGITKVLNDKKRLAEHQIYKEKLEVVKLVLDYKK